MTGEFEGVFFRFIHSLVVAPNGNAQIRPVGIYIHISMTDSEGFREEKR